MRQSSAPVTIAIVLVNCLVFIYVHTMLDGARETQRFVYDFGLNFSEFWIHQKVWQPLTSMFVHTNLLHFAFNMLALWSVGTPLEMTLNSGRFTFLYFVSGLAGSLFLLIFNADSNAAAIGASGAVFGLLGALAVFYPKARLLVFFIPMRAITAAAILAVLSVAFYVFQQLTFIAHMAHLGGLLGGLLYSKFALGLTIGQGGAVGEESNAIAPGGAATAASGGPESLMDRFRGALGRASASGASGSISRSERSAKEAEILRLMRGISEEPAAGDADRATPPRENATGDRAQSDDASGAATPPSSASTESDRKSTPSESEVKRESDAGAGSPNDPRPSDAGTKAPAESTGSGDPAKSSKESPQQAAPDTARQRLEYDPETGRFHIRE